MKVAITGASGFVGEALCDKLRQRGDQVVPLKHGKDWQWHASSDGSQSQGHVKTELIAGCDALVHLAGESIAARWNEERKRKIRDSRVVGTRVMAQAIADLPQDQRPRVMVSMSAIGYYGCGADEIITEGNPAGDGFLSDVAQQWELAAEPARVAGVRVVHPRLGLVLDPSGGAMAKMLPIFKLGGGGVLGDGKQYWSWITLEDVVDALCFVMDQPDVEGPVNFVAPEAVTNRVFTRMMGEAIHRPTFLPVPGFAIRLAMGQMADDTLLCSQRVRPAALLDAGYAFKWPSLEPALRHLLQD